uniref:Secreted protein n=1 Tax=Steinernema glaseri TaxID=37863 RepID=A0A1I8AQZ1_9BILA
MALRNLSPAGALSHFSNPFHRFSKSVYTLVEKVINRKFTTVEHSRCDCALFVNVSTIGHAELLVVFNQPFCARFFAL